MPPFSRSVFQMASSGQQVLRRLAREAVKSVSEGKEKLTDKITSNSTKVLEHVKPTKSTMVKIEQAGEKIVKEVAAKSHIPVWGILLILLVIVLILLAAFYFCLAKWWRRFRESDKGKGFKGLDLKSVNLIGQMGKEKVSLRITVRAVANVPCTTHLACRFNPTRRN